VMLFAFVGVSTPRFVMGILLLYLFAVVLGWFPIGGYGGLSHLVLPALTIGVLGGGWYSRMMRSSMVEVLHQDYIRTARAKGLAPLRVTLRHALRNALIPAITIVGLQFGNLLAGTVVIETVFSRQGLGRLAYTAILAKDFPIVQGVVLVLVVVYVVLNVAVDLSYGLLDPRIRYD